MSGIAPIAARLAKLVPMLSSDKDGEVVATAQAIARLLKSHGLDFHDLARAIIAPAALPNDNDWARSVDSFLGQSHRLSDRDVEFLLSVKRFIATGRGPTPKQAKWLGDIQAKLWERAA